MDYYFTIEKPSIAEFKDRGSKFLAYAYPIKDISDFKNQLNILKKEHPKAVHHCFAYRLGFNGDLFRVNDDGEPSGSAGKQILGQIDSKKLTNVAIIVVRYFGGTLLGVPGLINAYKSASSFVLQTIPIIQKPILISYSLQFDYTLTNTVMQILKQTGCEVNSQEFNLFSNIIIDVPKNRVEELLYKITGIHGVDIKNLI
jgi:uncharacterized YigZ family protein